LPEDVARRPKQGFEVPIDAWLRGPLREQFESSVLASNSRIGHLIHQGTASQLFHRHLRGVGRHGPTLWSLTVLAAWCERYLAVPTPAAGRSEVQLPQIASVHEGING
jgi:asparagine synthase (glutamine-hydrolysing)